MGDGPVRGRNHDAVVRKQVLGTVDILVSTGPFPTPHPRYISGGYRQTPTEGASPPLDSPVGEIVNSA